MRKKLTVLAFALTLTTGFAGSLVAQEQPRETAAERADRTDDEDDGMDLGWIGLLGLAGLLGLRRRDHVHVEPTPVIRTDSTTRTDTGYTSTPGR